MNIVFFAHPAFIGHQSMPRYAKMLADGMVKRGHKVELWFPQPLFYSFPAPRAIRKWFGYIDQYIVFPFQVRRRIKTYSATSLFVFTDQALGPWVPLLEEHPSVIHCHDFLAQRSALGEIPENQTSWTGRQYQRLISKGYSKGKSFISVSHKTKEDLHRFLPSPPFSSEVVYNGLNQMFKPQEPFIVRAQLGNEFGLDLTSGYLLHIGGNQFYKNRTGVIEIYNAWRKKNIVGLPLLLIGETPSKDLVDTYTDSPYKKDIHLLSGVKDESVRLAYAGASIFLFPSLAEGFGWPIAEAMASGCPVITTDEAPMTEVAGSAGFLISRRPSNKLLVEKWAVAAAEIIDRILNLSINDRKIVVEAGLVNAKRFDSEAALDRIEEIYQNTIIDFRNS